MKAWWVRTDYSEGSLVIFANTRNEARLAGMWGDVCQDAPYIDIKATRLPLLDGMEKCEPTDNYWLNEDIRLILVRDYGWACLDNSIDDCDTCSAKEYCLWDH